MRSAIGGSENYVMTSLKEKPVYYTANIHGNLVPDLPLWLPTPLSALTALLGHERDHARCSNRGAGRWRSLARLPPMPVDEQPEGPQNAAASLRKHTDLNMDQAPQNVFD